MTEGSNLSTSLSGRIRCTKGGDDAGSRMGPGLLLTPQTQREAPCSWAADENRSADRGPWAGGGCYCVCVCVTSSDYCFLQISDNAAELITSLRCQMILLQCVHRGFNLFNGNMSVLLHMKVRFVLLPPSALCSFS